MTFEQAVKELELTRPFGTEPVSAQELIDTLKEDVVLLVERPGSWEGSNMLHVLRCHGFYRDY